MSTIDIGDLREWESTQGSRAFFFQPEEGAEYRKIAFDVMVTAPAGLHIAENYQGEGGSRWTYIPLSVGFTTVRLTIGEAVKIVLDGSDPNFPFEGYQAVRLHNNTQTIAESDEESLTTIEPRPAGAADEVRRMMYVMQLNQQAREEQLRAELLAQWRTQDDDGDGVLNADDPDAVPPGSPAVVPPETPPEGTP